MEDVFSRAQLSAIQRLADQHGGVIIGGHGAKCLVTYSPEGSCSPVTEAIRPDGSRLALLPAAVPAVVGDDAA